MTPSDKIKQRALSLGFDACGICRAQSSGEEENLREWIRLNYQGDMSYLERNIEKRDDPRLLVEGAKSIISVALNYYPNEKRDPNSSSNLPSKGFIEIMERFWFSHMHPLTLRLYLLLVPI